ncbi:DUF362 domain-containing protein [bacterium]|nr:DUF362 domain-containing protein [bacterium]
MKKGEDFKKPRADSSISRRGFLSGISKVAAAVPLMKTASLFGEKKNNKSFKRAKDSMSKVVVAQRKNAVSGNSINLVVVEEMFDESLKALTGTKSVNEAWEVILPNIKLAKDVVSLKINCISRHVDTHREVSFAIAKSLMKFGVRENNIIIWDRTDRELKRAGYEINTGKKGVRCFGTDHEGVGHEEPFLLPAGCKAQVSRILSEYTDYLINVPVLKNHRGSGVTYCLKNHFGTFYNPSDFHKSGITPIIPQLNDRPEVRKKTILHVGDALYGVARGGPGGPPTFTYNGLMLGFDPVAMDYQAKKILEENGCDTIHKEQFIDMASKKYKLGNSEPDKIEVIKV